MDVVSLITTSALVVAVLAFARVVHLVARFGDDRAAALSRAFVVHGTSCLVLAVADVVVDPLGLPFGFQILAGLLTAAWGATWVIVGRAYDPALSADAVEAAAREERGRTPARVGRFDRSVTGYAGERVERRS